MNSLATYTVENVRETLDDLDEALKLLRDKHKTISILLSGVNFVSWRKYKPEDLLILTIEAYDRAASDEETKKKFVRNFVTLKRLYVLASPQPIVLVARKANVISKSNS
jgi:type I restriction enzyme R subunit